MILRWRLRVSAQHTVLLTNAVITLAAVACSSEPRAIKEERRRSQTEGSVGVVVEDIVPVLGGDAYAVGLPSGLWHLTRSTATRVHAVGDSATRLRFASVVLLEIQPTTDGGAYAFSPVGGIWRLDADSAVAVTPNRARSAAVAPTTPPRDAIGSVLYERERRKRRSAEGDGAAFARRQP
jgi:hypothetical protein